MQHVADYFNDNRLLDGYLQPLSAAHSLGHLEICKILEAHVGIDQALKLNNKVIVDRRMKLQLARQRDYSFVTGTLRHDIHYWLGNDTTQGEAGATTLKTIEVDAALGGRVVQYQEVQGHET
ncbi:Gelsolin domain-containing protein [Artemisia annua]|uniref:Gelsolin domain-containing protein n=1 Tax=Artemisia annua TaxID=35608 RepID=A0A2U1P0Y6_ARTAN|nr:Gelsolin domain-containing protein [Artemisia annua]